MPFDLANFDHRHPDYVKVFQERLERLVWLETHPEALPGLKAYYKNHIADFINDWGMTFDPRNLELGLPAYVPFILFPRQREAIDWMIELWRARERGVGAKSRDVGFSWLAIALGCSLCLFNDGMVFNFGSRKEEYVDKLDGPKSLFFKARKFMVALPKQFTGTWDVKKHAPHMRISFPDTQSYMNGEAGDEIGRGDRAAIYVVDESASLERPQLVEASLSATTNCRIDLSSAKGMENPFFQKWSSYPENRKFLFHWRDDPRKDDDWYQKQCDDLDPVTVAQEIDINFAASVEGIVIPSLWANACVDAHIKLGLTPSGDRCAGLDVADEGRDQNALAGGYGWLLEHLEEWSGVGGDIYNSVVKAFDICDERGYPYFKYDADGMGAGVRGDARVINEARVAENRRSIGVLAYRGSGEVLRPEGEDVKGRKNKDYFQNRKAQEWFGVRLAARETYRAVVEGRPYDPDMILSIPSDLPLRARLLQELSQPTYKLGPTGKIIINKTPEKMRSPNLADAVLIWRARASKAPMRISDDAVTGSR